MSIFNLTPKIPESKINYQLYYASARAGSNEYIILPAGDLVVTSGKIVACDPLASLWNAEAYNREFQPGNYPVEILIAKNATMQEHYASARLLIREDEAVKWELAITGAQKKSLHKLKKDQVFGFTVDAGMGCFCDLDSQKKAIQFLDEFLEEHPEANIYDDYFAPLLKVNAKNPTDPQDYGDWLNYLIPGTDNNLIMFQSGYGDGLYPAYWGLNQKGEVVSLVIDFLMITKGD